MKTLTPQNRPNNSQIHFDSLPPITHRPHPRSTRIKLRLEWDGSLTLSTPPKTSPSAINSFLKEHQVWIEQALQRHAYNTQCPLSYLKQHPHLSAYSHSDTLQLSIGPQQSYTYDWRQRTLQIQSEGLQQTHHLLSELHRFAKAALPIRVADCVARAGTRTPKSITVRNTKTRWGSCSARQTLSLNWKLILLPPHLCDHVILHELTHLEHMDHSQRFWTKLTHYDPETPENRKALHVQSKAIFQTFVA